MTAAARLLGFNHHQSLIALIKARHKELITAVPEYVPEEHKTAPVAEVAPGMRAPARRRRKHIFSEPRKIKYKKSDPSAFSHGEVRASKTKTAPADSDDALNDDQV